MSQGHGLEIPFKPEIFQVLLIQKLKLKNLPCDGRHHFLNFIRSSHIHVAFSARTLLQIEMSKKPQEKLPMPDVHRFQSD